MPIKDKDFGKYKRPGIFIEEIDSSIIELPVQDVLINLVPGFSKKGPFNSPIYVTNPVDFTSIFGDDDRRLENKGSFFHKTAKQMLKNGPVWALSLLATNPNRDKVDWQSISVSSQYINGDVKRSAYESFFNRQDFWERDSDAFLNIVKANNYGVQDNERLFHITNMGDKDITVFMFKSSITGFDVTAEEWYGDRTKVPGYIDYREWISDYMVTVIAVAGDWSDYRTLSNDPTFGAYFNRNGLIKTQVNGFLNERTVTILAKYDASLIPYFKDLNNRDMYIKSTINNNTDKTGLFCTYNEDSLLEADFKLGNLDIIGDSIVGGVGDSTQLPVTSIQFMSYETSLEEQLTYSQKYLDSSNNVLTNNLDSYNLASGGTADRTGIYTNGHVYQIYFNTGTTATTFTGTTGATLQVQFLADTVPYYVINGSLITGFTTTNVAISGISYQYGSRYDVLYLTNDNTVNVLYGTASNSTTGAIMPDYTYSLDSTIILGYILVVNSGSTAGTTLAYTGVSVDALGYIAVGGTAGYRTLVTNSTDTLGDYLNIEFAGTSGKTGEYSDYHYLKTIYAFIQLYNNVSTQSAIVQSGSTNFLNGNKVPVQATIPVDATSTSNAIIKIYIDNPQFCHLSNKFVIYFVDDEFLLHTATINTNGLKTRYDVLGTTSKTGIVATYSQLYQDYYNGIINNLDYFLVDNNTGNTTKIYLQMFLDQTELLTVDFLSALPDVVYEVISADYANSAKYNKSLVLHSYRANWEQSVELYNNQWYGDDLTTCQQIWVDKNRYSEVTRGSFLSAYYDEAYYSAPAGQGYLEGAVPRKLTRIIRVQNDPTDVNSKILYTDAPIKIVDYNILPGTGTTIDYQTFTYPSIDQYVDEYKALKISPFVVHQDSIPNGTDERQNSILNVISKDTNLAKALADKNKISWRYLVDSFGLGLTPTDGFGSKQQLADLCGMKLNCLGFISMPSAKIFRESTNPSFVNDDGTLNLSYVKDGADESKNPDFYYQFAQKHGEIDGRSTVGYFFPYIRIYDNGIPKWVPPASYAATTYMQKFTSNVAGMLPWTICAGITNGRVSNITKTEMDFTNTDLEYLYQMNANPIVYKINNGYCINSESTAQVFPYSSLSFLHSREVLINLENSLYDMLLRYQWSFNTPEIRAEIKYRADKICKDMLDSDAFYDFWNVCDETNNTDYVIDLQMGVLDTYVEIIKGMGIIVNNITILKKGDIQSMGFK
jgi:hypothetical protein